VANDQTWCFWTTQPVSWTGPLLLSQILAAVPAGCEAQELPRIQFAHSAHACHQVHR
jgi:hypothetical protein